MLPDTHNEWEKKFAEAGDMHSEGCCTNTEWGCDVDTGILDCCDNMRFLNNVMQKTLTTHSSALRKEWAGKVRDMLAPHEHTREYCGEELDRCVEMRKVVDAYNTALEDVLALIEPDSST